MEDIFIAKNYSHICFQPSFDSFFQKLIDNYKIKIYDDYCFLNNKLKGSNLIADSSILNYIDNLIENYNLLADIIMHPVSLLWLNTSINATNKNDFSEALPSIEAHFFSIFISCNIRLKQNIVVKCYLPNRFTILPDCYKIKLTTSSYEMDVVMDYSQKELYISNNTVNINFLKINENIAIKGSIDEVVSPVFVNGISIEFGNTELLNFYGQNFQKIDKKSWLERTKASFVLLEKIWPEMYVEIVQLIKVIVPGSYSFTKQHLSGSDHWTIGTIFTSLVEEPQLSDGLIHEYRHNFLNCILAMKDIFKPSAKQPKIYFSPWRPDPRPEIGVFHAIFVFASVTEYYFRICKNNIPEFDKEEMRFRLILETTRTLIAINELNSFSELNEFGLNLLKTIHIQIKELFAKLEIKPNERVRVFDYITNEYEIWKDKWKINSQGDIYNFLKSIYIYKNENI